jgi:hypothetical protein
MKGDAKLRVVRDVTIWRNQNELIATSESPAAAGELLVLERIVNGDTVAVEVCVVECRPTLVSGVMRHRLRLRIDTPFDGSDKTSGPRIS